MLNKYKGMGFREMPGSDVLGTEIVISVFFFHCLSRAVR